MFFELDDIKRRHSMYSDVYNVGGWVRTPDANWSWMYQRGAMIGVTASFINEYVSSFAICSQQMLKHYAPPNSLKQLYIFGKSIIQLDHFKQLLKNRSQYAFALGTTDIAARVAVFRYLNNGWQKPFASFEFLFPRKIPTTMLAALLTAPISIPFELARMAFYADKTFPKELQRVFLLQCKGYTSYFNALRRIPFEEGPYYLFKNTSPLFVRNFLQTFTMFYTFDFVKDKASWIWRLGECPYLPCKMTIAAFSAYLSCVFTYPFAVIAREMIEFWPKENGVCQWNGNYRKAMVWLWYNENTSSYFPGFYRNYFFYQFPWIFTTLCLSDSLGIFSYWQVDMFSGPGTNSSEDTFS